MELSVDGIIEGTVGVVEAPSETLSSWLIAPSEAMEGGRVVAVEGESILVMAVVGAVVAGGGGWMRETVLLGRWHLVGMVCHGVWVCGEVERPRGIIPVSLVGVYRAVRINWCVEI